MTKPIEPALVARVHYRHFIEDEKGDLTEEMRTMSLDEDGRITVSKDGVIIYQDEEHAYTDRITRLKRLLDNKAQRAIDRALRDGSRRWEGNR